MKNEIYVGYISPYVSGEMINSVIDAQEIPSIKKRDYLDDIVDAIVYHGFKNFVPKNDFLDSFSDIRNADYRLSDSDAFHSTCAYMLNVPLVTTDNKLINSQGLKNYIDVRHPQG